MLRAGAARATRAVEDGALPRRRRAPAATAAPALRRGRGVPDGAENGVHCGAGGHALRLGEHGPVGKLRELEDASEVGAGVFTVHVY